MSLLVRDGLLVSQDGLVRADLLLEEGKISRLEDRIAVRGSVDVLEVSGKLVLPGAVDPHVHMGFRFLGEGSCDDFPMGSRAALAGGTTTLLDFALPELGQGLQHAVSSRVDEGLRGTHADFGVHCIVREISDSVLAEIPTLVAAGVTSFKVFTAYDEQHLRLDAGELVPLFEVVGRAGGMITVHAEEPSIVNRCTGQFVAKEDVRPGNHPAARPAIAESAMVALVIEIAGATNCPVYFHHISTARAVSLIGAAKAAGQPVYAETCPHYLLLDAGLYKQENAVDYTVSPPLRQRVDQERLWEGIRDGDIDTVGTDHCPFHREQKRKTAEDFTRVPNGLSGVEMRLRLLYSAGVCEGRISTKHWLDVCCKNPAYLFGLSPSKGEISPGADADLVVFDPEPCVRVESKRQHSACDWDPYEGLEVQGAVTGTVRGGEVVWWEGAFRSAVPGRYRPRGPSGGSGA